jgi:hypothetical protein
MRRERAIEACERALAAVRTELAAGRADASTWRPPPAQLHHMLSQLTKMLDQLRSNELPPPDLRRCGMTHPIDDTWPYDYRLGSLITDAERRYLRA